MKLKAKLNFDKLYASENIAELLDKDDLTNIGNMVVEQYEDDKMSMAEWEKTYEEVLKIAKQTWEKKNTPWTNAANIKLPMITTASLQFAARSYPEVVRNGRIVNTLILGKDPDGQKKDKAQRVTDHMNYQLLIEDKRYEEGLDKLLHMWPIVGLAFKKVYYDPMSKTNKSELLLPHQIIINNNAPDLDSVRRLTHVIPTYYQNILEKVRFGIFSDICEELSKQTSQETNESDYDRPLTLLEQHRYLDLDGDGLEEPYVVTIEKSTRQVARIYRCFDMDGVTLNEKQEIVRIQRKNYFIDFHFIHAPDGSYHSLGLGHLLLPLNQTANSLINQLLDAGTLSNMPGGYLGRSFRANKGVHKFEPGVFKQLDISGEDIAKSVYKMPFNEPSQTLFQLLGLVIDQAKELASVTNMLQGQEKAQNVPATTALTLVEQGLKVFTAIQKRLYRSLKNEFTALFKLNYEYLDEVSYYQITDGIRVIGKDDYNSSLLDIVPVADPSMSSDAQRIARSQAIMGILQFLPPDGQKEALKNYLDSLNTPAMQIEKLLNAPPQQPSPADQKIMAEVQTEMMKPQSDLLTKEIERKRLDLQESELKIKYIQAETARIQGEAQAKMYEAQAIASLANVEDSKKLKVLEIAIQTLATKDKTATLNELRELVNNLELHANVGAVTPTNPSPILPTEESPNVDQSGGMVGMEEQPSQPEILNTITGEEGGVSGTVE